MRLLALALKYAMVMLIGVSDDSDEIEVALLVCSLNCSPASELTWESDRMAAFRDGEWEEVIEGCIEKIKATEITTTRRTTTTVSSFLRGLGEGEGGVLGKFTGLSISI